MRFSRETDLPCLARDPDRTGRMPLDETDLDPSATATPGRSCSPSGPGPSPSPPGPGPVAEVRLFLAGRDVAAGRLAEAEARLLALIAERPEQVRPRLLLAGVARRLGRITEAGEILQRAVELGLPVAEGRRRARADPRRGGLRPGRGVAPVGPGGRSRRPRRPPGPGRGLRPARAMGGGRIDRLGLARPRPGGGRRPSDSPSGVRLRTRAGGGAAGPGQVAMSRAAGARGDAGRAVGPRPASGSGRAEKVGRSINTGRRR